MIAETNTKNLPFPSRLLLATLVAGVVLASTHGAFSGGGCHPIALINYEIKIQEAHVPEDLPNFSHPNQVDPKSLSFVREDGNKAAARDPLRDFL